MLKQLLALPDRLLYLVAWLNAEPGRKRGLTILLAALGQALRQSTRLRGAAPWVDQVVAFIQGDMVPAVDALTWITGVIALAHPAAKMAEAKHGPSIVQGPGYKPK